MSLSAPPLHQCFTLSGLSFGAGIQRKCHTVEKVTFKKYKIFTKGWWVGGTVHFAQYNVIGLHSLEIVS